MELTSENTAGRSAVVSVRVKMAIGSSTSKVNPLNKAAARLVASRKYFANLQRGDMEAARLRALRKDIHSRRLPNGQIHPHHTRPMMMVSPMVTNASPSFGIHWRLANIALSAES